jgi:hypothetical protein
MKIGDIVTIKNRAGMLRVRIEKELSLGDVAKCLGDDRIPDLCRPRLEYHKGTGWGGHLVTLCGNLDSTPFNLYLLHITDYDDKPRCYVGVCDNTEEDIFETVC